VLGLTYYQEVTMNLNTVSIVDLSPPEKLQLVEDLWDDLAATPSEVPVYEWQKGGVGPSKGNLMNKPDSGLSWDDVKRRIRSRYLLRVHWWVSDRLLHLPCIPGPKEVAQSLDVTC
jgi:putative addiction module component (TIGR02574 family)